LDAKQLAGRILGHGREERRGLGGRPVEHPAKRIFGWMRDTPPFPIENQKSKIENELVGPTRIRTWDQGIMSPLL
jgi:hypothetical protein